MEITNSNILAHRVFLTIYTLNVHKDSLIANYLLKNELGKFRYSL